MPGSPVVTINLLITAGTLDPKQDAPAWIPGWGHITGAVATGPDHRRHRQPGHQMVRHQVDPRTGEAVAHGCARGQHQWPPPGTGPPGTGPPGTGPPGSEQPGPAAAPPESGVTEFVTSLNLKMERHRENQHRRRTRRTTTRPQPPTAAPDRARHATCATPGCDAAAVTTDMEHRIPWEEGGKTDEHNLDPPCKR